MVSSTRKKVLVLLDAHAVLHRAFHALPDFVSPKGEPTGALYGFTAFLLKIIKELKPDYLAACYDLPEPTFRHIAYEGYKAQRPKMEDALSRQIARSRDILDAFKIPAYDAPGFEADDIIGTITEKIRKESVKLKSFIATGDLDTLQLVDDDRVVVYVLSRGIKEAVVYNEEKVRERYGFGPELIPDFKGLMGDPSDNIPGVKGVGEKTASKLIQHFGSLENLYKVLEERQEEVEGIGIKPRVIKLLLENKEEAFFSKTLAEIRKDAPIEFSLAETEWRREFDLERIKKIFNELGFVSLIRRLEEEEGEAEAAVLQKEKGGEDSVKTALRQRMKGLVDEKFFDEVEWPAAKILKEAEQRGILIDTAYLKKLSDEYHRKLDELATEIWQMAGERFNINSPQQLSRVLFEKMSLKNSRIKRTASGFFSTNISQLEKLKGSHPIIEKIIFYRELFKLVSTYIDALPKMVGKDGRLHTQFDSAGTSTGRISSKKPNLQNIPIRSELGRKIRRAFIADKGFVLAAFDYSQIELRTAAILSGDKKLIEIFQRGGDIHNSVAAEVFGVSYERVDAEMRRKAKIINFGVIYGMGINSLAREIGCPREEALAFYEQYFKNFQGLARYLEKVKEFARKNGYTKTLFGRKRFFPEINSSLEHIRKEVERMAVNAPIQGTAADFIKMAMVKADKALKRAGLKDKAFLLLQIHDELLFEIKEESKEKAIPLIRQEMEGVYQSAVPLEVKVSVGKNWGKMIEYQILNIKNQK